MSGGPLGGGPPAGFGAPQGAAPGAARATPGRHNLSIRWRLIAALAGVSLFAVVIVGVIFYIFLAGYVVQREQDRLLNQALTSAEQIQNFSDLIPAGTVRAPAAALLLRTGLRNLPAGAGVVLFDGDQVAAKAGVLPVRAANLEKLRVAAAQAAANGPASGTAQSVIGTALRGVDLLYAVVPVNLSDGNQGLLVTTLPRSDALAAGSGLRRVLLLSAIIAIVVAIAVGFGLAAWLVRPLRRLSAAARGLAAGQFETPVTGSYPGEVQDLADSLEHTRAEVGRSQQSLRGFVAAAAHELRTPMTSIQGFSQALLDGTADDPEQRRMATAAIARESGRLQKTLDALLTLSRYDAREFHPVLAPVDIGRLVQEEVDRLIEAGRTTRDRVAVNLQPGATAVTDGDMLRQVVGNLLRNAAQYGGADPVGVWVRVGAGRRGEGQVVIDVVNGGPPLGLEDRRRLFERFYRGKAARTSEGLGLGLALSREICELLGATVELVGEGPATCFRVFVPQAARGRVLP